MCALARQELTQIRNVSANTAPVTIPLPKPPGVTKKFGNAKPPPRMCALARQELTQIRNASANTAPVTIPLPKSEHRLVLVLAVLVLAVLVVALLGHARPPRPAVL